MKGPLTSDGVHPHRDKRSAARLGKSPGILTPGSFFFPFFMYTIAKIKKKKNSPALTLISLKTLFEYGNRYFYPGDENP